VGTYYVKVMSADSYEGRSPIDCNYDLTVSFTSATDWESEYNDDSSKADTLAENVLIKGSLYKVDDVDWYKISITTVGYFNIEFAPDSSTNSDDIKNGWNYYVYDSSFTKVQEKNGVTGSYIGVNRAYEPGVYYIKVTTNDTYEGRSPIDCIYNLTVKTTASSLWESENNDSSEKADLISSNKTYHGLLQAVDDVDWYKVKVSGSGKLTVILNMSDSTNIDDVGNGWDLCLYKSATGDALAKTQNIKSSGKVTFNNVKKGTYYVRVTSNDSYEGRSPIDCEYTLKATFTEGLSKVSLKSATAGKKQVKLSWKKVSGASGYYVYRSTSKSGKYTKIATIKKGSTVTYTNKNLKSKQTYYYKVIAYKTANGKTTKGTASAVKSAKTK
jgi:hypothetical protein